MGRTLSYWGRPVFDVVLSILFEWHSEVAVIEAERLTRGADARGRAMGARLLASIGEARFSELLAELSRDPEEEVRVAVMRGIDKLLEYGHMHGRTLERELGRALYGPMRDCVLREDRGPGKGFAGALFACDRQRAISDFSADHVLTIKRNWLGDLLETLPKEGVFIPVERVVLLLDETLASLDRGELDFAGRYGKPFLIEQLLVMWADRDAEAARTRILALRSHGAAEARKAAFAARQRLYGSSVDVAAELEAAGGDLMRLRREHRVVYLVNSLQAEVSNGGWLQWVANSSGAYAAETLEALREVGAQGAAGELEKVMEALGPAGRSADQKQRMKAIDRMMEAGGRLPEDSVLWEMATEIGNLTMDYEERHVEAFPARVKVGRSV